MTDVGYSGYKMNGVSLQTYGWAIETMSGLGGMPGRRGSNKPTPFQDGDYSFGEKFYESRVITLKMVVYPQDANGAVTAADGPRYHLNDNMDYLKGVFNQNPGLQTLSHIVKDGSGGTVTRELDVEVLAGFEFTQAGKEVMTFPVILTAPRPLWREMPIVTVNENAITSFPHNFNIDTLGNGPIGDAVITIDVNAASSTPSLEVVSTGDLLTFQDSGLILNDQIILDLGSRTFTKNGSRADTSTKRVKAWFMRMAPAASLAMRFDALSGDYDLQIEYYKKWL